MANKIKLRRGLKSKLPTLAAGEPAFITDTREFFIGTGSGNVNMGGSHWYTGTDMSASSPSENAFSYSACPEVKVGDMYMNTSNGYVYQCTTAGSGTSAKWTYKSCLKGATGSVASLDIVIAVHDEDYGSLDGFLYFSGTLTQDYYSNGPAPFTFLMKTTGTGRGYFGYTDMDMAGGSFKDVNGNSATVDGGALYLCKYQGGTPTYDGQGNTLYNGDVTVIQKLG